MAEQLALMQHDTVYESEIASWEATEAYYSRPDYIRPLLRYLELVAYRSHGRCSLRVRQHAKRALRATEPFVEPCVGGGMLVTGLLALTERHQVLTGDIRDVGADWQGDWAGLADGWKWNRDVQRHMAHASLVATNPPFSRAIEMVEASWTRCPRAVVAMLQRATWYEPTKKREPWLRAHNPDQITIGRCEFFRPDGTSAGDGDSCSYTWYVWGQHRRGLLDGHHEIIPWQEAG